MGIATAPSILGLGSPDRTTLVSRCLNVRFISGASRIGDSRNLHPARRVDSDASQRLSSNILLLARATLRRRFPASARCFRRLDSCGHFPDATGYAHEG